jgi:hypothetical protein
MKNQTAVEWLIQELNLHGYDFTIQRAKELEKDQIIEAYTDEDNIQWDRQLRRRAAEQYYKETYNL